MMNLNDLNPKLWYVRLFFWSLGIWGAFLKRESWDRYHRYNEYQIGCIKEQGTNICFFLRVIFLYMPLVLFLQVLVPIASIALLTVIPTYIFGGEVYLRGIAVVFFFVLSFLILLVVIGGIVELVQRVMQRMRLISQDERKEEEHTEPSFFAVLRTYIVAVKEKVCPTITFRISKEEQE